MGRVAAASYRSCPLPLVWSCESTRGQPSERAWGLAVERDHLLYFDEWYLHLLPVIRVIWRLVVTTLSLEIALHLHFQAAFSYHLQTVWGGSRVEARAF